MKKIKTKLTIVLILLISLLTNISCENQNFKEESLSPQIVELSNAIDKVELSFPVHMFLNDSLLVVNNSVEAAQVLLSPDYDVNVAREYFMFVHPNVYNPNGRTNAPGDEYCIRSCAPDGCAEACFIECAGDEDDDLISFCVYC